ncbi:MAG: hypothetical protein AAFN10_11095, partial [Bacteroidota bacterium]
TFELDYDYLYGKFNKGESEEMYVITAESGNSLFSNLVKNKIYLYGSQLHFSLEEHKEGIVTHIGIDLETKVPQITTYPLPRYHDEAILQASSIVYEDLILLGAYQNEGLKLEIHELGGAGLSQAYDFAVDAEMDAYFLTTNAERNDGTQLTDKKLLHPYLKRSLILSVEPTAEGDLWLIVGSVPQMSPAAQSALYFSVTIAAAFMGAAIDPNLGANVGIDPTSAIESGGYFLLDISARYGKFLYRVGAINASDLSLKMKTDLGVDESQATQELSLPETTYDKMLAFLAESKDYRETAAAQIVFRYRNGLVKGFARKKEFHLYYFE